MKHWNSISEQRDVTCHMGSQYHTVLPAIRHKWTHPALTTAKGQYSIYYPKGMEGWVDLRDWLDTAQTVTHLMIQVLTWQRPARSWTRDPLIWNLTP